MQNFTFLPLMRFQSSFSPHESLLALNGKLECGESRRTAIILRAVFYLVTARARLRERRESGRKYGRRNARGTLAKPQDDEERYPCLCPLGPPRARHREETTLPSFPLTFPRPRFRPPSSGRNWADDLNARATTNGSLAPLTPRRRSVSRASTGRRFPVCGLRAASSGISTRSSSIDVTILRWR